MKAILLTLAMSQLVSLSASADVCTDRSQHWNGYRCVTTAAGVAVATGSGIYSAKKYTQADSIEKMWTEKIFQNNTQNSGSDIRLVNQKNSTFTNGDRIKIIYQLSESDNRKHHVDLLIEKVSNAESSARHHERLALTATRDVYETVIESSTDADGNTTTSSRSVYKGTEPDWSQRAWHGMQAISERGNAREYQVQADNARRGGPVPIYDFEKLIDSKTDTARLTADFNQERIDQGGKIIKIERLPVEKFNYMKSIVWKARGGVVGVAVGVGLAVEEAIAGSVAQKLERSKYAPAVRKYTRSSR